MLQRELPVWTFDLPRIFPVRDSPAFLKTEDGM
jgi:hypothetical protein